MFMIVIRRIVVRFENYDIFCGLRGYKIFENVDFKLFYMKN